MLRSRAWTGCSCVTRGRRASLVCMSSRQRPRLPLPLRVFVLALFALGLVLQPVLASWGELHELAHDKAGTHAHVDHSDNVNDELSASDKSDPGRSGMLHALMHLAHCCGPSTVTLTSAMRAMPVAPGVTILALAESQRPLQPRALAPFRPPISA